MQPALSGHLPSLRHPGGDYQIQLVEATRRGLELVKMDRDVLCVTGCVHIHASLCACLRARIQLLIYVCSCGLIMSATMHYTHTMDVNPYRVTSHLCLCRLMPASECRRICPHAHARLCGYMSSYNRSSSYVESV